MASWRLGINRAIWIGAWSVVVASAPNAQGQDAGDRPLVRAPREGVVELEEVVDALAAPREENGAVEFNILVYGRGDLEGARSRLDSRLKSRIDGIDRVCKLTAEQRSKLSVAGRGDIRRAFDRSKELKGKYADVGRRKALQDRALLAEIAAARRAMEELDCFGEGSLFAKVLAKTLTAEQAAIREKAIRDASNAQHAGTIRWTAKSLAQWLKLDATGQGKLESLLVARTTPPRKFGEYDYYGLIFQLSNLPEAELKPIFDAEQWQQLQRHFAEARRLEKVLLRGGFLPEKDVAQARKGQSNRPDAEPERPRS